jgi:hypothetical protein
LAEGCEDLFGFFDGCALETRELACSFKHEGVRWVGRPGKVAEGAALSARVKQRITG